MKQITSRSKLLWLYWRKKLYKLGASSERREAVS
jgi:hypothetical protein